MAKAQGINSVYNGNNDLSPGHFQAINDWLELMARVSAKDQEGGMRESQAGYVLYLGSIPEHSDNNLSGKKESAAQLTEPPRCSSHDTFRHTIIKPIISLYCNISTNSEAMPFHLFL